MTVAGRVIRWTTAGPVVGVAGWHPTRKAPVAPLAVLAESPITIDLDTTDVEVYDRKKHGGTGSVHSTRALLTLTIPANTMRDWITTGRAFMRARLAAAQLGLRFHPISQVLQEYRQMDQLPTEMNTLTGVAEPAKLQMQLVVTLDTVKSTSATCWARSARPTAPRLSPGPASSA